MCFARKCNRVNNRLVVYSVSIFCQGVLLKCKSFFPVRYGKNVAKNTNATHFSLDQSVSMQQPFTSNVLNRDLDPGESTIAKQIAEIDKQLAALISKRSNLVEVMMKVRQERLAAVDVSRKNSYNRVMIETIVVGELIKSSNPISTQSLRSSVRVSIGPLNESTFRSHLFRMQKKDIISSNGKAMWFMKQLQKQAFRRTD